MTRANKHRAPSQPGGLADQRLVGLMEKNA